MRQRFDILVQNDPQSLLRVVGLFAQRAMIPETLAVARTDDGLHVAIEIAGLDAAGADILVARLREGVMVIGASRQGAALVG